MTLPINVRATVIDLLDDTPQSEDIFLVDTNVWVWQTYSHARAASKVAGQKIRDYTPYLKQTLDQGATLAYSSLILSELAFVIEKTECSIFNRRNKTRLRTKEFRHTCPLERKNVVAEVHAAWGQVKAIAVPIAVTIDEALTQAALKRYETQALDGYDLFILESMYRAGSGQVKVITDDIDYIGVPDIQVFTANAKALEVAQRQGKQIKR
ncbi:MAG: hypothetical protein AAGF01_31100 [Cyanobacteria bacterium P01_G01_bin.38]